jgi:hypothetical protein
MASWRRAATHAIISPLFSKFVPYLQIMNKVLLAFICCAALLLESCAGCKENNPSLDFGNTSISDTTYVLAAGSFPSTPNPHNVLVEEFTGQGCSNCPAAHDLLKTSAAANPNRINIIGLYIYGPTQGKPPHGSIHDFRDSIANRINSQVYNGLNNLPSGGVDRVAIAGQVSLAKDLWVNAINTQLTTVDSLNIDVDTRYNATADIDTIIVKVTYIKEVKTIQNLSVVIVEDSMRDFQENGLHIEADYLFTNVFRDMVTPVPGGVEIGLDRPVKEPGRVYQKIYTYKPKPRTLVGEPAIKPKNCKVIAFVNNWGSGNYRIVQSAQCPLRK